MKVTYKEFAQFMGYKKPHYLSRFSCNFYLETTPCDWTKARVVIKWPAYLLGFLPVHIIKFLYCLWDEGIKHFTFENRIVMSQIISRKWE